MPPSDPILALKQDLNTLNQLKPSDQLNHLNSISTPLLRSIYISLTSDNDQPSPSLSPLTAYLLNYLSYDSSISVEAMLSLLHLKSTHSSFPQSITDSIDDMLHLESSTHDKFKIFKIVSHLFSLDSQLAADIFTKKPEFFNLLSNQSTLLSNQFNSLSTTSINQLNILLQLFSNACIEESSKSIVATIYINILLNTLSLSNDKTFIQSKSYAATTIIKLWRLIKPETLNSNSNILSLNNLLKISLTGLENNSDSSIQALSLLSTNIQIRQKLSTTHLVSTLIDTLDQNNLEKFGIISILNSITTPIRQFNQSKKSISSLNDSNSIENYDILTNQKLNSSHSITPYQKPIIDLLFKREFISKYIVSVFTSLNSSKSLISECLQLMYNLIFPDIENLSSNPQNDTLLLLKVKESIQSIKLITAYLIGTSQNIKYNHENFISLVDPSITFNETDLKNRSIAIKSLTSPFISENIDKIFVGEELALSPVPFILEIIIQHDIDIGVANNNKLTPFNSIKKQIFSHFDVYYSYVSLAAISSLNYQHVTKSVFTLGFDSILNTISDNNDSLQNAALQLLNEICIFPLCVAKFFNWDSTNDENYKNFSLLCYLIHSTNIDSQSLSLQILYTLSRFEIVAQKLAQSNLFCDKLNNIFTSTDSNDALIFYSLLLLTNILPLKQKTTPNHLDFFDSSKDIILKHTSSNDPQIKQTSLIVAKYL